MLTIASQPATQLGGKPDLIIGNYSDGNLVSSLLSHHLNTTQCTIAHALEKTKYPVRMLAKYHAIFGCFVPQLSPRAQYVTASDWPVNDRPPALSL